MVDFKNPLIIGIIIFIAVFSVHYYYEANDIRVQQYMKDNPLAITGAVWDKDLPCGLDIVCHVQQSMRTFTVTAPETFVPGDRIYFFVSNKDESWKGSSNNLIKCDGVGIVQEGCDSTKVRYTVDTKGQFADNTMGFSTASGYCYSTASVVIDSSSPELDWDINVDLCRNELVAWNTVSYDGTIEAICEEGYVGDAYCDNGDVYIEEAQSDCTLDEVKLEDCGTAGCYEGGGHGTQAAFCISEDARINDVDFPSTVELNEEFDIELEVENTGNFDYTFGFQCFMRDGTEIDSEFESERINQGDTETVRISHSFNQDDATNIITVFDLKCEAYLESDENIAETVLSRWGYQNDVLSLDSNWECYDNSDCLADEYCNGHVCLGEEDPLPVLECIIDTDCGVNQYCDENNECQDDEPLPVLECVIDTDCEDYEFCSNEKCEIINCDFNLFCEDSSVFTTEIINHQCVTQLTENCDSNEICRNGVCIQDEPAPLLCDDLTGELFSTSTQTCDGDAYQTTDGECCVGTVNDKTATVTSPTTTEDEVLSDEERVNSLVTILIVMGVIGIMVWYLGRQRRWW